jgi:hypothetical protein
VPPHDRDSFTNTISTKKKERKKLNKNATASIELLTFLSSLEVVIDLF